jgi:alkanesulfonate monooxygenase SsuD/methylene tetrahydromethanopterin reductase-like flavin-dependent oxidoreductase (luciferase family)
LDQKLRFGVMTLQNIPWEQENKRCKMMESMGFDSLWVADHYADFTRPRTHWYEAWTLLSGIATQTKKIRIGTLVSAIPWRNPAFLARQALTVDHLSEGRLELGLGSGVSGEIDPTYSMTGIEDWAPRERVSRFKEAVELIDQLLRNEETTYEGRYYKVENSAMCPAPIQKPRPPITIAAHGNRMLKIAARCADTWNSFGELGLSADQMFKDTLKRNRLLDRYCLDSGREPDSLRRSLLLLGETARNAYKSTDDFKNTIGRYNEIGITEFIIYYPFNETQMRVFEQLVRETIPELRDEEDRGELRGS